MPCADFRRPAILIRLSQRSGHLRRRPPVPDCLIRRRPGPADRRRGRPDPAPAGADPRQARADPRRARADPRPGRPDPCPAQRPPRIPGRSRRALPAHRPPIRTDHRPSARIRRHRSPARIAPARRSCQGLHHGRRLGRQASRACRPSQPPGHQRPDGPGQPCGRGQPGRLARVTPRRCPNRAGPTRPRRGSRALTGGWPPAGQAELPASRDAHRCGPGRGGPPAR